MRISRLDLTRYGHFTDRAIDFGPTVEGQPDLHIVYGPNEAGKSTTLAAILDFLFGIEVRSTYSFLHQYATMAIGATVEVGGVSRSLVRWKRNQNSLVLPGGQPADEGFLTAALTGVDRDAFREMFSMDDETLKAGGEGILASRGDLGRMLFSASAGLAEFSAAIDQLKGETDAFLRGRKSELATSKVRLAELKEERDRLDTQATRHTHLVSACKTAQRDHLTALTARSESLARADALKRKLGVLPRLTVMRQHREQLRALADLPVTPASWSAEMPGILKADVEITTKLDVAATTLDRLETELADIEVNRHILANASLIDALSGLGDAREKAGLALPQRRVDLRLAELKVEDLLRQLGAPGEPIPSRLLLDPSIANALGELAASRSGIVEALSRARSELAEAERLLNEARAKLGSHAELKDPKRAVRLEGLATALSTVQLRGHDRSLRSAERTRDTREAALADRIRGLHPWSGDAPQLAVVPVPLPRDLERWRADLTEAEGQFKAASSDIGQRDLEARTRKAELAAAREVNLVPDEEAGIVRATRERAWLAHRDALTPTSADAFEVALRRDDTVTNARLGQEREVVRLRATREAASAAEIALDAAEKVRESALQAIARVDREVAQAWMAICPAFTSPSLTSLEAWTSKYVAAVNAQVSLFEAERDLSDVESEAVAAHALLLGALEAAQAPHDGSGSLGHLMEAARVAARTEEMIDALRTQFASSEGVAARRRRELEAAEGASEAWTKAWSRTCSACWLGKRSEARSPAEVLAIIQVLGELGPALVQRASIVERIGGLEDDVVAFSRAVRNATAAVALDERDGKPEDVAARLSLDMKRARAKETLHAEKETEIGRARKDLRDLREAAVMHAKKVDEMRTHLGAGSLLEIDAKLNLIARRDVLLSEVESIAREIADALGAASTEQAEAALGDMDRERLEAEIAEAEARFAAEDGRLQAGIAALTKAKDELDAIGGDDAVARMQEERKTVLVHLSEGALEHLRLRTGIAATEHALLLYRERHRSAMLDHASEAFKLLSRGAYRGLASRPDGGGEELIAVMQDGRSKNAAGLSRGTRAQLYLALRMAGFKEFTRTRQPVPFLADDILETFDDLRAEEAFRSFADMAMTSQVVYLTHHPHLCRIAKTVCPSIRVHELEPLYESIDP